jgi:hypothetical protein
MFGVLITGRLVQTNFIPVDESKVVCNIENADNINHVVVFMTGTTPFPDGYGGAVYFSWPTAGGPAWHLLGFLTNDKPSSIFKVANLKREDATDIYHPFGQISDHQSHMMQIGISVETLFALQQLTPALGVTASSSNTFNDFCTKMVQSCFNHLASFAVARTQIGLGSPSDQFVPLAQLQAWYEQFQRRLVQNPNFWKS